MYTLKLISIDAQNIDAGVLSPYEHGETYVLDDGGEGVCSFVYHDILRRK
jgi:CTP synthase (UTP-ammonia lyase)